MDEYNIDRELEKLLEDIPEQEENFEKKIDKYIKKKIKTITMKTVLMLGVMTSIVFFLISPVMDAIFLNPAKLNKNKMYESVLRDYYDLIKPYIQIGNINVKKKGFGRYELGMCVVDSQETKYIGIENVRMDLIHGEYKNVYDPELYLTTVMYSLEEEITDDEKMKMISDFQKLPESAVVSLLIHDKNVRDVEELRKKEVSLDWIEVYHPNQPEFQGGINLHRIMLYEETDLREELTEAQLLQVYKDQLKNLVEHPEVWEPLGLSRRSIVWPNELEKMKACYEDAKTLSRLQTQYYYISGERDEIVKYIKKTDVRNIYVYKVKSSMWE